VDGVSAVTDNGGPPARGARTRPRRAHFSAAARVAARRRQRAAPCDGAPGVLRLGSFRESFSVAFDAGGGGCAASGLSPLSGAQPGSSLLRAGWWPAFGSGVVIVQLLRSIEGFIERPQTAYLWTAPCENEEGRTPVGMRPCRADSRATNRPALSITARSA
jgi:hypothetical protein